MSLIANADAVLNGMAPYHSEQISAHASASGFAMQFSVLLMLELNDRLLHASSSSVISVVPLKSKTARDRFSSFVVQSDDWKSRLVRALW